jgi:protein dithiol:quinone oxidoreductase
MIPAIRPTNLIIFLGCAAMILVGMYLEHVLKLEPCPLCITQRAFFDITGVLALIAFIHNPEAKVIRRYVLLGITASMIGGAVAARQLWIQSLPEDQIPACGPAFSYLFEVFPFMEAVEMLFKGDGSCAEPHKILGLSIAGWSLIAFAGLASINLFQFFRSIKKSSI